MVSADKASGEKVAYLMNKNILVRKWSQVIDSDWNDVYQIVVPTVYRQHVLSVAHESQWSGHLGVTKTYQLILRHFFWPGLKRDVAAYCRCCHVCQITGKPNQIISPNHQVPSTSYSLSRYFFLFKNTVHSVSSEKQGTFFHLVLFPPFYPHIV